MTSPLVLSPGSIRARAHEFLGHVGNLALQRAPEFQLSHVVLQASNPANWQKMKELLNCIAATRQEEDAQGRKVLWAVLRQPLEHKKYRLRGIALPCPTPDTLMTAASETVGQFTCMAGTLPGQNPQIILLEGGHRLIILAEPSSMIRQLDEANPVRQNREPAERPITYRKPRMVACA